MIMANVAISPANPRLHNLSQGLWQNYMRWLSWKLNKDKGHHQLIAQYLRFSMVGLSNAIVDLGALNLLLALVPSRAPLVTTADNTIAVILALINSYFWNTHWTFHAEADGSCRQRALFIAQAALNVIVNDLIMYTMATLLPSSPCIWYLIGNNAVKLIAMALAAMTSFALLRTVVFRNPPSDQTSSAHESVKP
jgi:putative flippase GtrA